MHVHLRVPTLSALLCLGQVALGCSGEALDSGEALEEPNGSDADGAERPVASGPQASFDPTVPGVAPATAAPSESVPEPSVSPEHVPCTAPAGVPSPPRSVLSVVEFLNAMPKPVTIPCFLEALPRPLQLYATRGIISAQPAAGDRSPRIFVFLDPLTISIVPEGPGQHLVEFGELRSNTRSLKAEIEFPVAAELRREDPFERLMYSADLTSCAFCHASEEEDPELDFTRAFVSQALRPAPFERVPVTALLVEHELCDPSAEPFRCAMLAALFDGGEVVEWYFPEEMTTFY